MMTALSVRPIGLRLWFALSLMALMVTLAACGADKSSSGGLVVRLESDLSMPKDFDRVTLDITQAGTALLSKDSAVGEGQLLLPAEFPIGPTSGPLPVTVHAVAYSKGHAVIERTAITTVPATRMALLHLPLNFLCLGTTHEDGSSTCGADQTCKQGLCAATIAVDTDLSDFDSPAAQAAARGAAAGGNAKCFDVLACLGDASKASVDAACSFTVPQTAQTGQLNVGLKLPLGSDGVCGAGACWVALDASADGWTLNGAQVTLPPSVCRDRTNQTAFEVSYSTACSAKTSASPPCGTWSSITDPLPATGIKMNPSTMSGGPPGFVGNACEGLPTESCGDCGTRTRTCQNGSWSDWSDCMNGGVCSIGTTQPCGAGGTQLCESTCQWGQCEGQTCYGPAIQACGNCGVQRRTCDAATAGWSAWGACTDGGVCAPGATEACGTNGTHACGGNCQWGACGSQVCAGAPSTACGNCGSETRTCDTATAKWSNFSACGMEGPCAPNATRTCGAQGTQICGGNCQWDAACSGQMCTGVPTQACGNCGAQTRTCDMTSGTWSDWSVCNGAGSCSPKQTRSCGAGGTQTCGDNCQWNSECVGQTCTGGMTQTCGMCGTQSRTCDSASGKWSAFGTCGGQGACAPGAMQTCGAKGTQTCGDNCTWGACTGQTCTGSATQACGKCGTQSRTCDANTGAWSDWGSCTKEGACMPTATQKCGNGGMQTCNNSCQWATCMGQTCDGPLTQACGMCGTQSRTCDGNTGNLSAWSACMGEKSGGCAPDATQMCGVNASGTQTCSSSCEWGKCTGQIIPCTGPAPSESCGNCVTHSRTCDMTVGTWTGPFTTCPTPGECSGTDARKCGTNNTGMQTCDAATCKYGQCIPQTIACTGSAPTESCGNCVTHSRTCDTTMGTWTGPFTTCPTPGICAPLAMQDCSPAVTGGSEICTANCTWGACICANNLTMCKTGCVDTKTDSANCGGCDSPCPAGSTCTAGRCPSVSTDAGVPQSGTGGGGEAGAAGFARTFDGGPIIEGLPR